MITLDSQHNYSGNLTLTSSTWPFSNMHIVNIVTQTDSSNYELWLCNDATFDTSGPSIFSGGGNVDISVNSDYNSGTNSVYMVYTDNSGSNQINLLINGYRLMPSALPTNDITYIDQDVPRNLLLHDIFLSIKLNDIKPMRNIYINSTPQNEGNLTLSDAVHWNKQYSFINGIKVVTTSTNWDLWLCETNEFSTSLITSRLISASRSGSYDISVLREYNSSDTNVRLIYTDNSGSATASFYITGEGRRSGLDDPSGTSGTMTVSGVTMSVAGWTLVSGTYEYNISNSYILSSSVVVVVPNQADTNTVVNAGIYPNTLSSDGSVKIYSRYAPQADIGVTINITNVW